MRLATCLALLVAALALLGGCGGSAEETTTSAPAGAEAKTVRSAWEGEASCKRPPGASRWGCSVGAYRCQAVVVDRGWSVSCAKPGESIAFRVRPG
jgi:hypothetical protein